MRRRARPRRGWGGSREWRAALVRRLFSTWTMRCRSAMARGRSGGRSMTTLWRPPPTRKVFRALVDQGGDVRGLRRDGERAGLDAAGIEQVADEALHVVGLSVDDAEELEHLGERQGRHGAEHGRGGPLDGGQRRAQLVAHHAQELRPQPVQFLQRRQVLYGHDHRDHRAVVAVDRRCVDQHRYAPPVGPPRARSPRRAPCRRSSAPAPAGTPRGRSRARRRSGRSGSGAVPPRGGPACGRGSTIRLASRLDDNGCPVRASKTTTPTGEVSTSASRSVRARCTSRCVRALTIAATACEANSTSNSSSSGVNSPPPSLPARKKLPTRSSRWRIGTPCRVLETIRSGGEAERAHVVVQVSQAQRAGQVPQVLEEARPVGPGCQLLVLLRREAGGDEVLHRACVVDGHDDAVAGAGERTGAVDDLLQHRSHVEARADAQDGRAECGIALLERLDLARLLIVAVQWSPLPNRARRAVAPRDEPGRPGYRVGCSTGRAGRR